MKAKPKSQQQWEALMGNPLVRAAITDNLQEHSDRTHSIPVWHKDHPAGIGVALKLRGGLFGMSENPHRPADGSAVRLVDLGPVTTHLDVMESRSADRIGTVQVPPEEWQSYNLTCGCGKGLRAVPAAMLVRGWLEARGKATQRIALT